MYFFKEIEIYVVLRLLNRNVNIEANKLKFILFKTHDE